MSEVTFEAKSLAELTPVDILEIAETAVQHPTGERLSPEQARWFRKKLEERYQSLSEWLSNSPFGGLFADRRELYNKAFDEAREYILERYENLNLPVPPKIVGPLLNGILSVSGRGLAFQASRAFALAFPDISGTYSQRREKAYWEDNHLVIAGVTVHELTHIFGYLGVGSSKEGYSVAASGWLRFVEQPEPRTYFSLFEEWAAWINEKDFLRRCGFKTYDDQQEIRLINAKVEGEPKLSHEDTIRRSEETYYQLWKSCERFPFELQRKIFALAKKILGKTNVELTEKVNKDSLEGVDITSQQLSAEIKTETLRQEDWGIPIPLTINALERMARELYPDVEMRQNFLDMVVKAQANGKILEICRAISRVYGREALRFFAEINPKDAYHELLLTLFAYCDEIPSEEKRQLRRQIIGIFCELK